MHFYLKLKTYAACLFLAAVCCLDVTAYQYINHTGNHVWKCGNNNIRVEVSYFDASGTANFHVTKEDGSCGQGGSFTQNGNVEIVWGPADPNQMPSNLGATLCNQSYSAGQDDIYVVCNLNWSTAAQRHYYAVITAGQDTYWAGPIRLQRRLDTPSLTSPPDNDTPSSSNIVLDWSNVTNADNYRIHIGTSPLGYTAENGLAGTTVSNGDFSVSNQSYAYWPYGTPGQTYYWCVRAGSFNTYHHSAYSGYRSFTVPFPASNTSPVLSLVDQNDPGATYSDNLVPIPPQWQNGVFQVNYFDADGDLPSSKEVRIYSNNNNYTIDLAYVQGSGSPSNGIYSKVFTSFPTNENDYSGWRYIFDFEDSNQSSAVGINSSFYSIPWLENVSYASVANINSTNTITFEYHHDYGKNPDTRELFYKGPGTSGNWTLVTWMTNGPGSPSSTNGQSYSANIPTGAAGTYYFKMNFAGDKSKAFGSGKEYSFNVMQLNQPPVLSKVLNGDLNTTHDGLLVPTSSWHEAKFQVRYEDPDGDAAGTSVAFIAKNLQQIATIPLTGVTGSPSDPDGELFCGSYDFGQIESNFPGHAFYYSFSDGQTAATGLNGVVHKIPYLQNISIPAVAVENQSINLTVPYFHEDNLPATTFSVHWNRPGESGFPHTQQMGPVGTMVSNHQAFTFTLPLSGANAIGQWQFKFDFHGGDCKALGSGKIYTVDVGPDPCDFPDDDTETQEVRDAIAYLCALGIIEGNDQGEIEPDRPIKRGELAKVLGLSVLNNSNLTVEDAVSNLFPVPYPDLQETLDQAYYYPHARMLLYLDWGDCKTPFDRNRGNFWPEEPIDRGAAVKAIMETFNLGQNSATPSPFQDLTTNEEHYAYIRRAADLGLLANANYPATNNWYPDNAIRRDEVFLLLHRILHQTLNGNSIASSLPTLTTGNNTQNINTSAFWLPSNYRDKSLDNLGGLETGNLQWPIASSFSIPGRGAPLEFTHLYNSATVDLPGDFYPCRPLSLGWTHTYNCYIHKINGNDLNVDDKYLVVWPDGSIHLFDHNENPETEGIYYELDQVSTNEWRIERPDQVEMTFKKVPGSYNDAPWMLTRVEDRYGNALQLAYVLGHEDAPQLDRVQDAAGRQLSFSYWNGSNRLKRVTDPLGRQVHFGYNSNNLLSTYTNALNGHYQYEYGNQTCDFNLLTSIELPKGNVVLADYDQRQLLNLRYSNDIVYQLGRTYNYTASSSAPQLTQTVDMDLPGSSSVTISYQLDQNGMVTHIGAGPANSYTNVDITWHSSHPTKPAQVVDNRSGITTTYNYHGPSGQISTRTVNGGGLTTTESWTYNPLNDLTGYTDANGHTTDYVNSGPILSKIRDAEGHETLFDIDPNNGDLEEVTSASGVPVKIGYDAWGNRNSIELGSTGIEAQFVYDGASRLIEASNFNGHSTTYSYDALDRLIQQTDPLGHSTLYGYDANSNLETVQNARGFTTTQQYDHDTDFLTSASFEGDGRQYSYHNPSGRLASITLPDNTALTYTYDSEGRVTDDGYAQYTYHSDGTLQSISRQTRQITYSYDGLKRVSSVHYNGDGQSYTIGYQYDLAGNLTTLTYPNNQQVSYTYLQNNWLHTVTDWNGDVTTYNYRPDGQLHQIVYPNGVYCQHTYTAGRLTGKHWKRSNNTDIAEFDYVLDGMGNHTEETINGAGAFAPLLADNSVSYSYANDNSLTTSGSTNYTYSDNGNRLSKGPNTYSYDARNNLLAASGSFQASYTYDGAGNRRTATKNGGITHFALDIVGMSRVLLELDNNGNTVHSYVYGLGLISRISGGSTRYYIHDSRGSTVAMVHESSAANVTHEYSYDAWGNVTSSTEADFNAFRYVGQWGVMYEDADLYFMRARYYDPEEGRFLSEDPVWSVNLYPYGGNNPINRVDANGKQWQWANDVVNSFRELPNRAKRTAISMVLVYGLMDLKFSEVPGGDKFFHCKYAHYGSKISKKETEYLLAFREQVDYHWNVSNKDPDEMLVDIASDWQANIIGLNAETLSECYEAFNNDKTSYLWEYTEHQRLLTRKFSWWLDVQIDKRQR